MFTSFPPLILGSSHAFHKYASDQPSESISLSEKNYPRSCPLTIPNPWRGLSKDEHTTRCVEVALCLSGVAHLSEHILKRCS